VLLEQEENKNSDLGVPDVDIGFHCSLCGSDFTSFGHRFKHYQVCDSLKKHDANINK
jgi:hypothetical protein